MSEEQTLLTVAEMLRMTGANQADFLEQVAVHIEKLEEAVSQLKTRVEELEAINGNNTSSQ
jgi:hypothetical protein